MNENEVYEKYKNLADSIAYKYRGIAEIEDLQQVAYEALINAYRKFDESTGFQFTTYAYKVIWSKVFKHLAKDRPVPISTSHHELVVRLKRMDITTLTPEQLAKALSRPKKKVTVNRVKAALKDVNSDVIRLDKKMSEEGDGTILDTVISEHTDNDFNIDVENYLKTLDEREIKVYKMRMDGLSQMQIANEIGLSQTMVRKILIKMQKKYNKYFQEKY